jgi:hypothetical protein
LKEKNMSVKIESTVPEHMSIYEYSSTTCTEAIESKTTLGEKIVEKNRDRKIVEKNYHNT